MKQQLAIVIVNFNTEEFLDTCLASIFRHYREEIFSGRYQVIVVDNASTNDSKELLSNKYPQVLFICNSANIGFSQANNVGIKKASGKYVLLLNPDTVIVEKQTLPAMLAFMDSETSAGIATCRVELGSGALDDACHRGFPTPWRALTHFAGFGRLFPDSMFFNGYHLGYRNLDKTHEIDACAGAFMLVRRRTGEQLGWFDQDYFWYGEDLDFCFRAKQAGWSVFYVPSTKIIHHKGVASGIKKHSQDISSATYQTRKKATQARFDVMRLFYQKHYKDKYPFFIRWFVLFGINCKYLFVRIFL